MKDEYIKELQAIVRLLVFQISCEYKDVPIFYLFELAYGRKNHFNTEEFASYFLVPGEQVAEEVKSDFIDRFIKNKCSFPVEEVKRLIRQMPYVEFLETTYWKSIALYVKKRDGGKCTKCGSGIGIQVHHLTYEHHGDELHYLDDLVCVCEKCHKEIHENRAHQDLPVD